MGEQIIISSIDDLKSKIIDFVKASKQDNPIISVDGFFGVGKTTILKALCAELGYKHIELDRHLDDNIFEDKINYNEYLSNGGLLFKRINDLVDLIHATKVPIILDGAFVENLLHHEKRINRIASVYLKRVLELSSKYKSNFLER